MKNLAGNKECDEHIKDELQRAGIAVEQIELGRSEVPYTFIGKLGHYTFHRAWYYWVVTGDTPMDVAKKIYAHPEGKATVRAGGHCGCEPPETQSDYAEVKDGLKLISQKEVDKLESGHSSLWEKYKDEYRIATEEEENTKVVNCYHIDSQAGLLLFALIV